MPTLLTLIEQDLMTRLNVVARKWPSLLGVNWMRGYASNIAASGSEAIACSAIAGVQFLEDWTSPDDLNALQECVAEAYKEVPGHEFSV